MNSTKSLRVFVGTALIAGLLAVLGGVFLRSPVYADGASDFVTTWKTDNDDPGSSSITVRTYPYGGVGYHYDVDWDNDGTFDELGITGNATHDFGTPGTYTIRIRGEFSQLYLYNSPDAKKIVDVNQWGTGEWQSMEYSFRGASNLTTISATDTPNLSAGPTLNGMFYDATSFNSDISHWDVSAITDMSYVFRGATSFNQSLADWDTRNVTMMYAMFNGATSFNQDLSAWGTGNVTNMFAMFGDAIVFNGNLSTWDTSKVTDMGSMFTGTAFNQDISDWDTSNVTDMSSMFRKTPFSGDLSSWDTSKVTDMSSMFNQAPAFNGDIANWNVSNVTSMQYMFSAIPTDKYDALLTAWAAQPVQQNVIFDAGYTSFYCNATGAHATLTDDKGWTIADGGSCHQPTISFVTPNSVYVTSNDPVELEIHGSNFEAGLTVDIGGQQATIVTVTPTVATVTISFAGVTQTQAAAITVTNPGGQTISTGETFLIEIPSGPATIDSVEFLDDGGKKELVVHGQNMMGANGYMDALSRSLVTMNSVALPFCAEETGQTAQGWIDSTVPSALVSDGAPCYFLIKDGGIAINGTTAYIWLPDGFDTSAQGTISVNGILAFIFNAGSTSPGEHEPTFITNLAPGLTVTTSSGIGLETGQTGTTADQTLVQVKTNSGILLAEVMVDMSTDRDWSSVTGSMDIATKKSFVHGLLSAEGNLSATFALYVPKSPQDDAVIICPGASSLAQITTDCHDAVTYTAASDNVEVVIIDGQAYWKVSGLTGTGGMSLQLSQAELDALADTGESTSSMTGVIAILFVAALVTGGIAIDLHCKAREKYNS